MIVATESKRIRALSETTEDQDDPPTGRPPHVDPAYAERCQIRLGPSPMSALERGIRRSSLFTRIARGTSRAVARAKLRF